jgi:hypothetical protein
MNEVIILIGFLIIFTPILLVVMLIEKKLNK